MRFNIFKKEKTFTIKSDYGIFECKESETILDAANRSKVTIPHQCGMGICESCKTVINGASVLACQYIPSTDCELEFNENLIKSEVISTFEIHKDIFEVVIKNTLKEYQCLGKHLEISLNEKANIRRKYSIVSICENTITMHIRSHRKGSISPILTKASPGYYLYISRPMGSYTLSKESGDYNNCFGIANGTGMGVTISLVDEFLSGKSNTSATIISVTRKNKIDKYHNILFEGLKGKHKERIKILSSSIEEITVRKEVINQRDSLYLVCGSSDVTDLIPQLINKDCDRDSRIIRESFI